MLDINMLHQLLPRHMRPCVYMCRWLGKDTSRDITLQGSRTDPRPPMHNYKVTVITSDIRNAGTDADVFIDIKGQECLLCTCKQATSRLADRTQTVV